MASTPLVVYLIIRLTGLCRNRNDTRAAKALSLRGQTENNLMKEAHREAARILYEERNKDSTSSTSRELYVDLHGKSATQFPLLATTSTDLETRPPS